MVVSKQSKKKIYVPRYQDRLPKKVCRKIKKLSANWLGQITEVKDMCFQKNGDDSSASIQIFLFQKNQLADLQEHMER